MKCTVRDILEAHAALSQHGGLSLTPSLAMRLGRLTKAIRAEAEIALEARTAMVERHLERDANGEPIEITLPGGIKDRKVIDQSALRADVKLLMDQPVEISGEPFTLADFGNKPIHSDLLAGLAFAITG